MAHIAERMMSHYQGSSSATAIYCCPDANQIATYLNEVTPRSSSACPRVWEKIYNGVNAALGRRPREQGEVRRRRRGGASTSRPPSGRGRPPRNSSTRGRSSTPSPSPTSATSIGLDASVAAVTGAAPIPRQILEWFQRDRRAAERDLRDERVERADDVETRRQIRPGTVGQADPGLRGRASPTTARCSCRGGNVFKGYFEPAREDGRDPRSTAGCTRATSARSTTTATCSIVDRKKELIITSGGKNISPANLEAALKTIPLIGQAAAIGDNRKFCSAILVLDPETRAVLGQGPRQATSASLTDLADEPDVVAEVQRGVDEVNKQFAQVEQIKKFTLVGEEWLPDSDMLTPTSKLKRRGVDARYADEIEAMYAGLG